MKRILLIDDHPIMRHGLAQLVRAESDLEVCAEASSAAEGLDLIEKTQPDLAIVDLSLKDKHGLELIKDIQTMFPKVLLIVLSMHDESLYAERALRAGSKGYVMKEMASETLIHAVRKVLGGGIYLSERMTGLLLEQLTQPRKQSSSDSMSRLTDRELEVLQLIGQGKATRHIAQQLHISVRTVDAHRAHLREKLQLPDGAAVVRYAVKWAESQK